jgi:putative transposase
MMTDRGAAEGAMARSAEAIVLSEVEREELDRLVRAHSTPQQLALRTQIILLAADGIGNRDSARRLGVTVQTVRCWRRRWDGSSAGRPAGRCATSGDAADFHPGTDLRHPGAGLRTASGVPITHWSQSALAREAVKRGLVETISHGSVGRFLKGG